jgi:hypothetical protein
VSGPDWDIEKIKSMRRRDRLLRSLSEAIQRADAEEANEEVGVVEPTRQEVLRRLLIEAIAQDRAQGGTGSKASVGLYMHHGEATIKRMWRRARRPHEEWPPMAD